MGAETGAGGSALREDDSQPVRPPLIFSWRLFPARTRYVFLRLFLPRPVASLFPALPYEKTGPQIFSSRIQRIRRQKADEACGVPVNCEADFVLARQYRGESPVLRQYSSVSSFNRLLHRTTLSSTAASAPCSSNHSTAAPLAASFCFLPSLKVVRVALSFCLRPRFMLRRGFLDSRFLIEINTLIGHIVLRRSYPGYMLAASQGAEEQPLLRPVERAEAPRARNGCSDKQTRYTEPVPPFPP